MLYTICCRICLIYFSFRPSDKQREVGIICCISSVVFIFAAFFCGIVIEYNCRVGYIDSKIDRSAQLLLHIIPRNKSQMRKYVLLLTSICIKSMFEVECTSRNNDKTLMQATALFQNEAIKITTTVDTQIRNPHFIGRPFDLNQEIHFKAHSHRSS